MWFGVQDGADDRTESIRHAWSVGTCLNQRDLKLEPKKQRFALDQGGTEDGNGFSRIFIFLTNQVKMNVGLMGASDILIEYVSPACAVK